jgi:hypothetical protein
MHFSKLDYFSNFDLKIGCIGTEKLGILPRNVEHVGFQRPEVTIPRFRDPEKKNVWLA